MSVEMDALPQPAAPEAVATPGWTPRRTLVILGAVVVLYVSTYALAWFSAYRLSLTYLGDANASFEAGNYLDALVGHKDFDRATGRYISYGGYMQIERIWADPYAQPVPPEVVQARARIDEIVYGLLTREDAERFVRENAGRNNPYLGMIYLRLGELYEAAGETRDAEDIYASFADLFPDEVALIARAQAHLARLQAAGN
jgi:tetratricopeptide (TPR) repeat protein